MEAIQNMQAPKSHKEAKQQVKFLEQQMKEMRARPQPDQAAIQQQSMAKKAKDTILQTGDIATVKAKVAELVESVQGGRAKFLDPDFDPKPGDHSLLFNEHDTVSEAEAGVLQKLSWQRPEEISLKTDIIGFTELNRSNQKEVDNLSPTELADFRRISYGTMLENRWLLNAVSMVASERRQLNLVTCEEEPDLVAARKMGIYVFRFFKTYRPHYVIIDDRLPTQEMPDGKEVPFFARCRSPHLFWVSLLEKAYAKLHGRYFALDGGDTDEALEDLCGLPVEKCFVGSPETMTDRSHFYNAIKTLCLNHCLLGCKIDHEILLDSTQGTEKAQKYAQAESKGL